MNQNPDDIAKASAGHEPLNGDGNSAEYCRAKAQGLVQAALDRPMGDERALLERSAAAWSMRAEQLQRRETRLAVVLTEPKTDIDHVRL